MFFFFSSRRRHTRLQGDWSSDVCSSDLALALGLGTYLGNGVAPVPQAQREPDTQPAERRALPAPISSDLAQRQSRSEEHTSELQSPCNLVCRLLLEKKKKKKTEHTTQRR